MNIRQQILVFAKKRRKFQTPDVSREIENKLSRQYISRVLSDLVKEKHLVKAGSTNKAFYALPKNISVLGTRARKRLLNQDLKEHEILEALKSQAPFTLRLRENIRSILDYAFSEMLNNAIEHSKSKRIEVEIIKQNHFLYFAVRDFGIGVFRNVMNKRNLKNEYEAMEDLLKGKTTTAPRAHSGEGIFFTSKTADKFVLESFGFRMIVDNLIGDVFFERTKRSKRGTKVLFSILLNSKKHLNDIFRSFQSDPKSFAFDKTEIQVKLFSVGTVHVSRSQARRILSGLDKFKVIILDFDRVPTVGQAFADEIFRVFRNRHPEIKVKPLNMNEAVEFMVRRVGK